MTTYKPLPEHQARLDDIREKALERQARRFDGLKYGFEELDWPSQLRFLAYVAKYIEENAE